MNKFTKRIKKCIKGNSGALVIGNAFGYLENLINIYNTVFVVSFSANNLKNRNLVYRENFEHINDIGEVAVVLVDLVRINDLEKMPTYWTRYKPAVLVEGNDPLDRSRSVCLYRYGYRCTDQLGFCHVWKKI